jgi:hypothetical protein
MVSLIFFGYYFHYICKVLLEACRSYLYLG